MSDETKITDVDVTPKGAAFAAAQEMTLKHAGKTLTESLPDIVAAAIEAYERQRPYAQVRLLCPAPGDVVLFNVAEPLTMQELQHYEEQLNRVFEHFEGVRAIVTEGVTDITVTRPPESMSVIETSGLDALREVADQIAKRNEEGETDGQR